jgi:hypothetical protein
MRELRPVKMHGSQSKEIISFECAADKNPLQTLCQVELIRRKTAEVIAIVAETESIEELLEALIVFPFPSANHEPLINSALRLKDSMLDLILRKAMTRLMELHKDAPEPN